MFTPLKNVFDASGNQNKEVILPETLDELKRQSEILDNIPDVDNNKIQEKVDCAQLIKDKWEQQMTYCITGIEAEFYVNKLNKLKKIEEAERRLVNEKIYAVDDNGKMKK